MQREDSIRRSGTAAAVVMGTTLLSRILGFARVAVIGAVFGASGKADVVNLVFSIPNNLRKLMAEGALSSAFIPVLSSTLVHDPSRQRAQGLVRTILTFQFVLLLPVLVGSTIFASPIINTILDFPEAERQRLAAELFRWMVHYTLLISVSAVLLATLNSHKRFFVPAATPLLFSIAVIIAILLLHWRMGVYSVVVGVLVGGVLQVLFQFPLFARLGYSVKPKLAFNSPEFRKIMRQWGPVVGTASIFAVNQQIALLFASGLEDGSGSAVTNALTFWQLPFGIFAISIQTVLFPRMSRQVAQGDTNGLRESLEYGLRYLLVLLLPSALVLSLMGKEIIAVALQRGAFESIHTIMASEVLTGYCYGLFSVAAFNFVQRFFYSRDDYRYPLLVAFVTLAIDVGLSLWLKETYLRVVGLAIANSVAFSIGLLLFLTRAWRILGGLNLKAIAGTLAKTALAAIPLTAAVLGFRALAPDYWLTGSSLEGFLLVGGAAILCMGIVAFMYYLLRVEPFMIILRERGIR
jgi:putative peptidoglycan lipid II flippase